MATYTTKHSTYTHNRKKIYYIMMCMLCFSIWVSVKRNIVSSSCNSSTSATKDVKLVTVVCIYAFITWKHTPHHKHHPCYALVFVCVVCNKYTCFLALFINIISGISGLVFFFLRVMIGCAHIWESRWKWEQ
jgi:hypothetical protein